MLFWPVLTYLDLSSNCIVKLPPSYLNTSKYNCSAERKVILKFPVSLIRCDKTVEDIITQRLIWYLAEFGDGSIRLFD